MPVPKDKEVRVKIHATSVTASDALIRWVTNPKTNNFVLRGLLQIIFGFGRPKNPILGMTCSGEVDAVGKKVTKFKVGDQVFAYGSVSVMDLRFGSYAEYICYPENWNILPKPTSLSHQQCAAIPYGGFLGLHCIRQVSSKCGDDLTNKKVLIYGASGSIGTMALQFARNMGATVTAVCSSGNFELVKSLGAEKAVDYNAPDAIAQLGDIKYDLVVDCVGEKKTSALKKHLAAKKSPALEKGGKYFSIDDNVPQTKPVDFAKLREMAEAGKLTPVIDRCFPLEKMAEAHAYVDQGHKKGNVVISVTEEGS